MTEQEALSQMIAPGMLRPGKTRGGVLQIWLTRACDKACFGCTQGSNLAGKPGVITPEQFRTACSSLYGYFGTVGIFGGNPALHPHFEKICKIALEFFPKNQLGLWCNHPKGKGKIMRETFNPATSNLNVHLDQAAYKEFRRDWPESRPFGLHEDSRHSPPYVAMQDVVPDEGKRWELIAGCDINRHWSAMIGVFRGQLRGYFCEIAGAQAMLHQHEPEYPDTGVEVTPGWWKLPMSAFAPQARKHCHECGVPLRGRGELAVTSSKGAEQTSKTHQTIYYPKRTGRPVQVVDSLVQLGSPLHKMTDYLGNAKQ